MRSDKQWRVVRATQPSYFVDYGMNEEAARARYENAIAKPSDVIAPPELQSRPVGSGPKDWKRVLILMVLAAAVVSAEDLSLRKQDWQTYVYNFGSGHVGYMQTPLKQLTNGLSFAFPTSQAKPINYLAQDRTAALIEGSTLTFTVAIVAISGTPTFHYDTEVANTCSVPAIVRPYFQGLESYGDFERWWSNPSAIEVVSGVTAAISVPLTPDQWSSVYGAFGNSSQDANDGWHLSLNYPGKVGLSFGGGCFFGHGVYVTGGTAEFRLLGATIQ